jgi:hypothetical protein
VRSLQAHNTHCQLHAQSCGFKLKTFHAAEMANTQNGSKTVLRRVAQHFCQQSFNFADAHGRYVKTDGAHGGVIFLRPVSLQSMPHAQLWRRHKLRFFARINKNYQICCYQSGSLHIASFAAASFVRDADSLSYKKRGVT